MNCYQRRLRASHQFLKKETCQGSQVSMSVARGSASLFSRYDTGVGPQDTLKQDSQGLSRVAAGNPGFRRLLPVDRKSVV